MAEPWLRFPVVCPECRREELNALPVAGVAAALLNGSAIPLHASCHDVYWHAIPSEIEQLREYLSVAGISIQKVKTNSTNAPDKPLAIHFPINAPLITGKECDS